MLSFFTWLRVAISYLMGSEKKACGRNSFEPPEELEMMLYGPTRPARYRGCPFHQHRALMKYCLYGTNQTCRVRCLSCFGIHELTEEIDLRRCAPYWSPCLVPSWVR